MKNLVVFSLCGLLCAVVFGLASAFASVKTIPLEVVYSNGSRHGSMQSIYVDTSRCGFTNELNFVRVNIVKEMPDIVDGVFEYPYVIRLYDSTNSSVPFKTVGFSMKRSDNTVLTEGEFADYLVEWKGFTVKNRIEGIRNGK